MKAIVEEINRKLERQEYLTIADAKNSFSASDSGFYWIYTTLNISNFQESDEPTNSAHVNMRELSIAHENLNNVIKQQSNEYWCIYNGKGKQLLNRLNAEFTNTKGSTGTLALNRCFNESDFRIKVIRCDGNNDLDTETDNSYESLQKLFERAWRLNYDWPILCRA